MRNAGILFMLLVAAHVAFAQPTRVQAGIYALNIGKFEVSTGSYTIDFYLSLKCDSVCDPDFEFMNGRANSVDKLIDEPDNKFYRINAALSENIDLKNYPLDRHSLPIIIEDKKKTTREQVFEADLQNSGIDPKVTLVGWNLLGWDSRTETHYYRPYQEEYSRLQFDINIGRIFLTSFLKAFLPVLFIVITGLLALLIEEKDKLVTRLGVNTSAIIAAVMFHLNVTSSIPPTGYLTLADKFMLVTYLILLLSMLSSIMMVIHTKKGEEKLAHRIYRTSLSLIPPAAALLYLLVFLV